MDKTITSDCKNSCDVHRLPESFLEESSGYGLRIWLVQRNAPTPARPIECPRRFEFYSISHLLDGEGFLWYPGKPVKKVKAGQAIIMTPDVVHNYGALVNDYTEDSLCFYGPIADELFRLGFLKGGVVNIGQTRLLLPILELALNPSPLAQVKAKIQLQELIIKLHSTTSQNEPTIENRIHRLTELLQRQPEKWWTIGEMANYCQLSESRFRTVFRVTIGISPKRYIDELKINQAAEYLVSTDCKLEEVAGHFGYVDQFHFSRRFKQIMGGSPTAYRGRTKRQG